MARIPTPADWKKALGKDPKAIAEADGITRALAGLMDPAEVKLDGDLDKAIKSVETRLKMLPIALKAAEIVKAKNKPGKDNKDALEFTGDLIDTLKQVIKDGEAHLKAAEKKREENDRKEDEEPDEDGDLKGQLLALKKTLQKLRTIDRPKARPFVLALGKTIGVVIPKRPPINKDHKTQAREMREGKGKLLYGICYGEDGKAVFELDATGKPPGGLAKNLKKSFKLHTKLDVMVLVRAGEEELDVERDVEEMSNLGTDEETESTAAQATEPTARVDAPDPQEARLVAFKSRAAELNRRIDELAGKDANGAAERRTELATALGLAQGKLVERALAALDAIEKRLNQPPDEGDRTAAEEAAPQPRSEPTTDPGPGETTAQDAAAIATFTDRARALNPRIKVAIAQGRDPDGRIKDTAEKAAAARRKGEVRQALEGLDAVEELLVEAERARDRPGGVEAPSAPAGPNDQQQQRYMELMRAMMPSYLAAIRMGGEVKARLEGLSNAAREAAKRGDYASALETAGQLERAVAGVETKPKPDGRAARGFVQLMKSRREWEDAQRQALGDLELLRSVVLDDNRFDPRLDQIQAFLDSRRAAIEGLDDPGLARLLNRMAEAQADQREQLRGKALAAVDRLRSRLAAERELAELEENPWLPVKLASRLEPALAALAGQLSA